MSITGRWVELNYVRPEYTTKVHASVTEGEFVTMSHNILRRDQCLVPRRDVSEQRNVRFDFHLYCCCHGSTKIKITCKYGRRLSLIFTKPHYLKSLLMLRVVQDAFCYFMQFVHRNYNNKFCCWLFLSDLVRLTYITFTAKYIQLWVDKGERGMNWHCQAFSHLSFRPARNATWESVLKGVPGEGSFHIHS